MEEKKKGAIETLREQIQQDYDSGYKKAIEMIDNGILDLQEVEGLATSDEPWHDILEGESKKYIEGFTDACREMLRKAKESED